ncbi:MAG: single-stranded DNA-binding protein [Actinomycetota bacterium]
MNTVTLIGRLTQDPELRFTDGGTAVCTIRLAVPRRKRDGVEQPPVYIDVVTFGAQAEAITEHCAQGRRVGVTGRLEYQQWEDNEGAKHSKHEVVASQVDFLDKPRGNGSATSAPTPAEVDYAAGEEAF